MNELGRRGFWDAMVVWSKEVVVGESDGDDDDDDDDMQDFSVSVPSGNYNSNVFRGDVYTLGEHGANGGTSVDGGLTYGEFVCILVGFFLGCGGIMWLQNLR